MADKALKEQETKELDSKEKEQRDFPDDPDLIIKNEKRCCLNQCWSWKCHQ